LRKLSLSWDAADLCGIQVPAIVSAPAYTAVLNLLERLRDPGQVIAATPSTDSISADATMHYTILKKRDGSYRLLLWVEVSAVDPIVPMQSVTFSLPPTLGSVIQSTW
jgi:hypothetical protein